MLADPGFGRFFTDRMFIARYRAGQGWYDARLTKYGPLQVDPSMATLHYAQSIFEGLKAYAQPDGTRITAALRVTLRQAVYLAAAQDFAREIRLLPRAAGDRRRGAAGLRMAAG